ncbi:MAG: hypothetical protein JJU35_15310, partial [Balneolales bacterium]|nr:hypothetical protein [Balneolales bacterium]
MKNLFPKKPVLQKKQDPSQNRRTFIRNAGLGGLALGLMFDGRIEEEMEYITQRVKRSSKPSELKITDMRIAWVEKAPMPCPIIRI